MLSILEPNSTQSQEAVGIPYLKVQLTPQIPAVLTMDCAQEALIISAEQLTLIPNMPLYMLGLLNRRGRIYWVIDLPNLLGLSAPMSAIRDHHIVLTQAHHSSLGFAVPKIQEVLRLTDEISPVKKRNLPDKVLPFLRGSIAVGSAQLLVLEPATIFDAAASPTIFSSSADFAIHR